MSNAIDVAEGLPDAILRVVAARRNARLRKTRSVSGGRPLLARCPGCSQEMASAEMREHRMPCIRRKLKSLIGMRFQLSPKDPDPHPDFYIDHLPEDATEVQFHKGSNDNVVTIDLRKIADIRKEGDIAHVRVLGYVAWHADIKRWRFQPTGSVGRPPKPRGASE
jgi:hypothetical protein